MAAVEDPDNPLDRLIEQLRLWHGGLRIEPGHFSGWSLGARFYPILYMLTRVGEARDWGTGLPLKSNLLGKMNKLEVHHIFPKAILYIQNFARPEVNAIANFCFLTKGTNLEISASPPEAYFPEVESKHPGSLASQWIPMDQQLWKLENYRDFLEARRTLLAEAANRFMAELLHGDAEVIAAEDQPSAPVPVTQPVIGGVDSAEEEEVLLTLNQWVTEQGLPEGSYLHELADQATGQAVALLDLAWPEGLQEGLSQPVALLINEEPEVLTWANSYGYRCFTSVEEFRAYVTRSILARDISEAGE